MSERLHPSHEHHEAEKPVERVEHHHKSPEHHEKHEHHKPSVETIKHSIEQEAISKDEVQVGEKQEGASQKQPLYVNKELKKLTYDRTLTRVRRHLGKPNRVLSKVVHQPAVDTISRVGEKTVARPVSLLTGSILAFIGTTFVLYMSRHYGFKYNFLLFALVFVSGYALGLIIELLISFRHRRSALK